MIKIVDFINRQVRALLAGLVVIIIAPFSFILFVAVKQVADLGTTMLALTLLAFVIGHIIKRI